MCLYLQAEAKKLEDSSMYLSLASTKPEMEERNPSSGKNTQNLGSFSVSKDSFQILTLVCSTKLTQNGETRPLSSFLNPNPITSSRFSVLLSVKVTTKRINRADESVFATSLLQKCDSLQSLRFYYNLNSVLFL